MLSFPIVFDYVSPRSLKEVFEILSKEDAIVFAGGTDIFIKIREKVVLPKLLVDLKKVDELWLLSFEQGKELIIGATNTLNEIIESPAVRKFFPLLLECCLKIGNCWVRNKATLVGNICSNFPLADSLFALFLYDSQVEIMSAVERRRIGLIEIIDKLGRVKLKRGEIITKIFIPYKGEHIVKYYKLTSRFLVPRASFGVAFMKSKELTKIAIGSIDSGISVFSSLRELKELLEKSCFEKEELLMANRIMDEMK